MLGKEPKDRVTSEEVKFIKYNEGSSITISSGHPCMC